MVNLHANWPSKNSKQPDRDIWRDYPADIV